MIADTLQKSYKSFEKDKSKHFDLAKYVPILESFGTLVEYFKAEEQQKPSSKEQLNRIIIKHWKEIGISLMNE